MGTYSRTYSFTDGTTAYGSQVAFELDALGSSCNNIVNAQIANGAAIADAKLAQITTASKVALSGLVQGGTGQVLLSGGGTAAWGALDNTYAMVGSVVQVVNTKTGATASGTTAIPYDDSIPQQTEGDERMTLAITPKSATNILKIDVVVFLLNADAQPIVALFQDSTAGALACGAWGAANNGYLNGVKFTYYMVSGTASATTFKIRCGGSSGTTYFNGGAGGRYFGGSLASSITITEIKAS